MILRQNLHGNTVIPTPNHSFVHSKFVVTPSTITPHLAIIVVDKQLLELELHCIRYETLNGCICIYLLATHHSVPIA